MLKNGILDLATIQDGQKIEIIVDNPFIRQQESKTFTASGGRLCLEDGKYLTQRTDPAQIEVNLVGPGQDAFIYGSKMTFWGQIREIRAL